ncbi:hypothetical protein [Priestia megaterium]|uniref:hypothetical protein n=1 Tax=Priestia megaterium TaxID=1404 RepID=UPI003CF1D32F
MFINLPFVMLSVFAVFLSAADLFFRVSPPLATIGFLLSAAGLYEERGKNKLIPLVVLSISFIMLCQAGYHFIHMHTPPPRP